MFRLLILAGLGFAGYTVAKRVMARGSAIPDAEDLYGSADIHRVSDQRPMS
jgi:hypothetical protein